MADTMRKRVGVVIRPLKTSDDREELVDIAHRAFSRHLERGLNYGAGAGSVADFERSVQGSVECFVAEGEGRLVGSIFCGWPRGGCAWYERSGVFTATQLAVDPDYQGLGIGRRLKEAVEQKALECGATEYAVDTASPAHDVIEFNKRLGARVVDRIQWSGKTYESVVLSKQLRDGPRIRISWRERLRWWLRRKRVRFTDQGLSDLPRWFRALRRLWWLRPRLRQNTANRQVLLVARSPMMLPYVLDVLELLEHDDRISVSGTATESRSNPATVSILDRFKERGVQIVSSASASVTDWDLVVLADHGAAHSFAPRCPKVMNWHGIDGSKVIETGEVFRYCRRMTVDKGGRPVYECMFDSSDESATAAVEAVPELKGRVVVVGDRRADRLFRLEGNRTEIRRKMGIADDETAVLLGSTFGTDCLFETVGPKLLEQAVELKDRYRFILSAHPQLWPPHDDRQPSMGERLLEYEREHGFIVHRQPGDLFPYLAAADLLITDFGSLVVNYALLRKPVAFVPFPDGIVSGQSFVAQIMSISPQLENAEDLPQVLERLSSEYPTRQLDQIAQRIVSCPGEADQRMRRELYRLLALEPPRVEATGRDGATVAKAEGS